jgi:hypothetical protein
MGNYTFIQKSDVRKLFQIGMDNLIDFILIIFFTRKIFIRIKLIGFSTYISMYIPT